MISNSSASFSPTIFSISKENFLYKFSAKQAAIFILISSIAIAAFALIKAAYARYFSGHANRSADSTTPSQVANISKQNISLEEENQLKSWTNGIKAYAKGVDSGTYLFLDNLLFFMKHKLSAQTKKQLSALVKNNIEIKQEPVLLIARINKNFNFVVKNPNIQPEGIEISPSVRELFKQICAYHLSDAIECIWQYKGKEK